MTPWEYWTFWWRLQLFKIFNECNMKMKKCVSQTNTVYQYCMEQFAFSFHTRDKNDMIKLSWQSYNHSPWIHFEDIFCRIHWFPINTPYSPTLLSTLHSSLVKVLVWLPEEHSGQLPKKRNKLNTNLALILLELIKIT